MVPIFNEPVGVTSPAVVGADVDPVPGVVLAGASVVPVPPVLPVVSGLAVESSEPPQDDAMIAPTASSPAIDLIRVEEPRIRNLPPFLYGTNLTSADRGRDSRRWGAETQVAMLRRSGTSVPAS